MEKSLIKNFLKNVLKKTALSVAILVGGAILGYLLLSLVFFIPISPEKTEEIVGSFSREGYYPRANYRNGNSENFLEYYPDVQDNFTDEMIFEYSMGNPTISPFIHCLKHISRYWHGYAIIIRPFMKIMGLAELRTLNMGAQLLLAAYLAFLLYFETKKKRYSLAWLTVYFMLVPNLMSYNFQNSDIFYIGVISAIVYLRFKTFFNKNYNFVFLFLVTGMCTSYFDFLTYPIMSFGIPAAVFILFSMNSDGGYDVKKSVRQLLQTVLSFGLWGIGYLGFWFEKWVLSDLIAGETALAIGMSETRFRTGANWVERLEGVNKNWLYMAFWPFIFVIAVWVSVWCVHILRKGLRKDARVLPLSFLWLVMLAWYIAVGEHSRSHTIFTWRSALISIVSLVFIICVTTEAYGKGEGILPSLKSRLFFVTGCLIVCFGLALLVPSDRIEYNNYWSDGTTEVMPRNAKDALEFQFTPQHRIITEMELLLKSDDLNGYYDIFLADGEKTLYTIRADQEKANSANIHYLKVFWPVTKNKTYTIRVSNEGVNADSFAGYAYENSMAEIADNDVYPFLQVMYYTVPNQKRLILWNYITILSLVLICGYMALSVESAQKELKKEK